ncbi:MAG: hypothetical protein JSS99_02700 [Actinobacteria bacterium]|nr:hypothetical protein [Actinomycetota bacterium]
MLAILASAHSAGYRAGQVLAPVAFAAGAIWLVRRARRQPAGRARTTDLIAALVCAVLLVAAVVRALPERQPGVWESDQGRQIRAGFVAGCQQTANGTLDCGCLFDHLTGAPPGNTSSGFAMLAQSIQYAVQRGDWSLMRPEAREALLACRAVQAS